MYRMALVSVNLKVTSGVYSHPKFHIVENTQILHTSHTYYARIVMRVWSILLRYRRNEAREFFRVTGSHLQ